MMNTLPSQSNCSTKSNGSNPNQENLPSSAHLTEMEINHHQRIEAIQSFLHPQLKKLMNNYPPFLIAEALDWFCDKMRETA